jgi:O-antigen ligase
MQHIMVVIALMLYAAFAFNPILEISIFSRTLNLSPGDMFTILFVFGIFLKALLQNQNNVVVSRPPAVIHFLFAFLFLAIVFLLPTLLFFVLHNELVSFLPRSLYIYLLWLIALVLFYYGSDSQLKVTELRTIVWLLMGSFIGGVISNIFIATSGFELLTLMTASLTNQGARLGGQIADPNQLGSLATFFSILGIMGALNEKKRTPQLIFMLLTVGTGFILVLTQSRESLLTLFVAMLCILFLLIKGKKYRHFLVVFWGLIIGVAFSVMNIPRIAETFSALDIGDTGYVLSARDQVWRTSLNVVLTYPLGIGFENLTYVTNNATEQAHNAFLQSAVIAGFLGFFAFVCFIIVLLKLLWEQSKLVPDNWLIQAYFVFIVGYLATSMGSDHFISFFTFNAIFFGLLGFVVCSR